MQLCFATYFIIQSRTEESFLGRNNIRKIELYWSVVPNFDHASLGRLLTFVSSDLSTSLYVAPDRI